MRSRKAGLPFVTRAWKRELSIQEIRIENDSYRNIFKSNFFPSFSKNHFFHDTCYPVHYKPKIFFRFSKSAATPPYTILDSRFPPVMRSRKAGLPFATRARKRELSIQEIRIENDSDRKFSKSKFFQVFLKTTFFHDKILFDFTPEHESPTGERFSVLILPGF